MQCVKRFATAEFLEENRLYFYELPFRTQDDYDNDLEPWSDDEIDPPYPSYHFDVAMLRYAAMRETAEKMKEVLRWSQGILREEKRYACLRMPLTSLALTHGLQ
jgi:hypothetical protein